MSDYLWDKTGEADAEVERLEHLLAPLRHVPRPLELPAEAAPSEPRRAAPFRLPKLFHAPRSFAPYGLAAAAALLLACLLVASAFLRARVTAVDERRAASETVRPREDVRVEQASVPARPAEAVRHESESLALGGEAASAAGGEVKLQGKTKKLQGKTEGKTVFEKLPRAARARGTERLTTVHVPPASRVLAAPGVPGAGEGFAFEAVRTGGGGGTSLVEGTRLLAKEQLIYALRLTGARLREVRQKARGSEDSRPEERRPGRSR